MLYWSDVYMERLRVSIPQRYNWSRAIHRGSSWLTTKRQKHWRRRYFMSVLFVAQDRRRRYLAGARLLPRRPSRVRQTPRPTDDRRWDDRCPASRPPLSAGPPTARVGLAHRRRLSSSSPSTVFAACSSCSDKFPLPSLINTRSATVVAVRRVTSAVCGPWQSLPAV